MLFYRNIMMVQGFTTYLVTDYKWHLSNSLRKRRVAHHCSRDNMCHRSDKERSGTSENINTWHTSDEVRGDFHIIFMEPVYMVLPFASVSKRVSVRKYSYVNLFLLQIHFHANQIHFHWNGFARGLG